MNLYHISQSSANGYATYSDAVVAAESEDIAKTIHPRNYEWKGLEYIPFSEDDHGWPNDPSLVTARLIGVAGEGTPRSVICASFHAE